MVALVSARTELRRAGVNSYFGLCPFHQERTASFHVRPDEKHYHCFGCQASGDPFDFVMETEGLDFKGALEALANRFGVQLQTEAEDPRRHPAASGSNGSIRCWRAAAYYERYLADSGEAAPAREYLVARGFTDDTLSAFRVGYAPSAWDRMLLASRNAGCSDEELLAVGLVQRSKTNPGRTYDRFRERIMFPAADARGRVLGFGARAMRDNQLPKYLNTSDGELYHKRSVLFGIDLARAAAAKGRDDPRRGVHRCARASPGGAANVVAIMGTSLTEEQVAELRRIVGAWDVTTPDRGNLDLCLDADRAGQEAMLRAAKLAEAQDLRLRVVPLPEGKDPADLVQAEGVDRLRERVASSVPFVEFHVDRILERADATTAEGKDRAIGGARSRAEARRLCGQPPRGAPEAYLQPARPLPGPPRGAVEDSRVEPVVARIPPARQCRHDRPGRPRRAGFPRAVHRASAGRPARAHEHRPGSALDE